MDAVRTHAPTAARILLGLIFFVFGLNGFLNFIPMPPPTGDAATFMGGLAAAGYFFPLLKATEVAVGVALLSNRFVPLALVVLAPITVNIFAMHVAMAPEGLPMAIGIVVLQGYLAKANWSAFRSLLQARPDGTESDAALAARTAAAAA